MKVKREKYEDLEKRLSPNALNSSMANAVRDHVAHYFAIYDDEDNFLEDFCLYDADNNWLAMNLHDKNTVFNDEKIMKEVFDELKINYDFVILRISEEFTDRIEQAKKYGFKEVRVRKQGDYNYIELGRML